MRSVIRLAMPLLTRRLASLLLLLAPLAACASGGASGASAPSPDADTPPRLVSPDKLPIRTTMPVVGGRSRPSGTAARPAPFTISVLVDTAGRADLRTLRITGLTDANEEEQMRRGLVQWLQEARFEPARRGGVPVPGTYRRTYGG